MNPEKQQCGRKAAALGIVSNELSQGFLQTQPCVSFCSSACGQSWNSKQFLSLHQLRDHKTTLMTK